MHFWLYVYFKVVGKYLRIYIYILIEREREQKNPPDALSTNIAEWGLIITAE